ncbi:MAG: hypothetical protein EOT05_03335 [Candidatus Microsaccharimonas sossegonensis]|uniref:Uncharacterized protein n=1 Tax=Candidatus Microsaccharimonas sossegonensis TaxID=2506948 RepID=A0A4Q0AI86_9BACT|nr:MAG: hypothetical protein EOT05_03335 [Candidatus Microsaccharimonas sossegonensis]
MASFFDTTIGQQVEFQRVLASAGFTDSDIARIIKEPSLASTMYVAIQPKLVATVPSWYVSPEQQLERARQLWSNVPYLNRWDDDRQLKLNDNWADNRNDNWSSPSVRDCS